MYRFVFDEYGGNGRSDLFDPVTSPKGTWYLVTRARPDRTRSSSIATRTAPVGGTGSDATVLAATINLDFDSLFPDAALPVYTSSTDTGNRSACQAACAAVYWPPLLTSGRPLAGPGVHRTRSGPW